MIQLKDKQGFIEIKSDEYVVNRAVKFFLNRVDLKTVILEREDLYQLAYLFLYANKKKYEFDYPWKAIVGVGRDLIDWYRSELRRRFLHGSRIVRFGEEFKLTTYSIKRYERRGAYDWAVMKDLVQVAMKKAFLSSEEQALIRFALETPRFYIVLKKEKKLSKYQRALVKFRGALSSILNKNGEMSSVVTKKAPRRNRARQ